MTIEPAIKLVTPVEVFIVTTCVANAGPLQPAALAVIVVVPLHPDAHVTAPVAPSIVFPAVELATSRV